MCLANLVLNQHVSFGIDFSAGVVSFTDPPVLTWHQPIYFSYLAVVLGTLLNIRARGQTCWGLPLTLEPSDHTTISPSIFSPDRNVSD